MLHCHRTVPLVAAVMRAAWTPQHFCPPTLQRPIFARTKIPCCEEKKEKEGIRTLPWRLWTDIFVLRWQQQHQMLLWRACARAQHRRRGTTVFYSFSLLLKSKAQKK
jgi:hypothetical protein